MGRNFCRLFFSVTLIMSVITSVYCETKQGITNPALNPVRFSAPPAGQPVVVVRNGKPQAVIVIAEDRLKNRNSVDYLAAVELQKYIKLASGAELPIVSDKKKPEGNLILIGDSELTKKQNIVSHDLPPEGFRLRTFPGGIAIVGAPAVEGVRESRNGVRFGVYDFLERYLGIRWYYPGEDGQIIPKTKDLSVSPVNYSDWPKRCLRLQLGAWDRAGEKDYNVVRETALHYRSGKSTPVSINCHTPTRFNIHFKQHPECFELNSDGSRNPGMPCYGNPETADLFIQDLERFYKKGDKGPWEHGGGLWGPPSDRVIYISPPDKEVSCHCKYCKKLLDKDAPALGRASRLVGDYVARVARKVKKLWPDKQVYYLPYSNYTLPPKDLKLPDNVVAAVCLMYGVNDKEPKVAEAHDAMINGWKSLTGKNVFLWEYPCWPADDTFLPFQYPHVLKSFQQRHIDSISGSGLCGGQFDSRTPTLYCWYRLMWNPDFDVDAALAEFVDLMYGPAKEPMEKILKLLTDRWERVRWRTPLVSHHVSPSQINEETMPRKQALLLRKLLEEARKLAGTDTVERRRVDFFGQAIERFLAESDRYHNGGGLPELRILKVGDNPNVDGKLNETCWKDAGKQFFKMGYDRKNPVPQNGTSIQAVWTGQGVTFGFQMKEPEMGKIRARWKNRDDAVYADDCVELFVDVSGKRSNYYQIIVNSLGTIFDRSSNIPDERNWNGTEIKAAAYKGKDFWSMEIFMPFKDFPDCSKVKIGTVWYGNFTRSRYVGRWELQRWSTLYRQSNLDFSAFGKLRFVE